MTKLATSMFEAWGARARCAADIIANAQKAPALFKPETIEQAQRDYARAYGEVQRWSA